MRPICPVCQKQKELDYRKGRIFRADPETRPVVPQRLQLVKVLRPGSPMNGIMEWKCPVLKRITTRQEYYADAHYRRRA